MFYSCTHMATVGVKGLTEPGRDVMCSVYDNDEHTASKIKSHRNSQYKNYQINITMNQQCTRLSSSYN